MTERLADLYKGVGFVEFVKGDAPPKEWDEAERIYGFRCRAAPD